jgi:hypothetical protein
MHHAMMPSPRRSADRQQRCPDQPVEKLFPRNSTDAQTWWSILPARYSKEKATDTIVRSTIFWPANAPTKS